MDYDRNIHHNPDAMAWAKFFVETTKDMGREVFCDEGYMVGWFANAMMAMHDSMKPHEAADEIERLREQLKYSNEFREIMNEERCDALEENERLREIIDKQMVKEFADRWANHILYDQPKIPQGFPSLLDALKEKE